MYDMTYRLSLEVRCNLRDSAVHGHRVVSRRGVLVPDAAQDAARDIPQQRRLFH